MPEIEFRVVCEEHNNQDLETSYLHGTLYISPCELCLDETYTQGREEGLGGAPE